MLSVCSQLNGGCSVDMCSIEGACFVCLPALALFSKAKGVVPVVLSAVHAEVKDGCPLALLSPLIHRLIADCLAVDGQSGTTKEVASSVSSGARGLASPQSLSDSLPGNVASGRQHPWWFVSEASVNASAGVRVLRANEP